MRHACLDLPEIDCQISHIPFFAYEAARLCGFFTMPVLGMGRAGGVYEEPFACRLNSGDSAYLTFTPGSAGNRRTFTAIATWFVRVSPDADLQLLSTGTDANNYESIYVRSDNKIEVQGLTAGSYIYNYRTPEIRRNPTPYTHVAVAFDTTQATASNRVKIWVDGVQIAYSTFTNVTDVAQNTDSRFNNTVAHSIGRFQATASGYSDTYLSQTAVLINGSQLPGTDFVEFDEYGNPIPKDVTTITRGTNGALLDYSNSAAFGQDQGSGTNDWTSSGLTSADQVTSTPTNVFATWNPLDKNSAITLADGNLVASGSGASDEAVAATMAFASGKWVACAKAGSAGALRFGVTSRSVWQADSNLADITNSAQARAFNLTSTTTWSIRTNGGATLTGNLGFTFVAADDYVVAAFDVDAAKLWFGAYDASANTLYWYDSAGTGRTSDEPGAGTNATYSSITTTGGLTLFSEPQVSCTLFAGATGWPITSPSGFEQMCTANLTLASSLYNIAYEAGLSTNLKLAMDAVDFKQISYGQYWFDPLNPEDFSRGANATASTDDPTLNGSAGVATTYWSFDGGDFFRYLGANPTWLQNFHKDNAALTIVGIVFNPTGGNAGALPICGTTRTTGTGFFYWGNGGPHQFVAKNGGSDAINKSGGTISENAWHFLAVSLNEATGAGGGFLYKDGAYDQVSGSDTFTSTYSSPSASSSTDTLEIGSNGNAQFLTVNGGRMQGVMIFDTALSKADLDTLYAAVKAARPGLSLP